MWRLARQPRWIAALVLALAIAAAFAALGQWQFSRSIVEATVVDRDTETVRQLTDVVEPQTPVMADVAGLMVSFEGTVVPGDSTVLTGRLNGGEAGYWVMAHVVVDNGASVAVALGWAETEEQAEAAAAGSVGIAALVPFQGRYLASEAPQEGDFESGERNTASVAALINEWSTPFESVYGGYVVSADAPDGLVDIDSPVPDDEVSLNWLNIFYAAEWAVFAVFAIFLWYRLVRDAWEREQEFAAEDAAEAAAQDAAESAAVDRESTPPENRDPSARTPSAKR
ncbi:cytochrome oxidase assembly protein ShyY1 [Glaciihabitans tibetensis]|uniref:SURF1-like protein n=1 Tax=Glaciihabitans tibetensis TaxID=1266600 RepID=A0A2T0VBR4_9MICO|nr:SURF1 family cytochrome oxidase biogenesis protein [Glaciihabitans tibetensis]PRY67610.1 cytochrome oxidase assembly protein ShyY1 [Glaciihabitans tibetensis]